jgi:nicotinamidase/pyrazinamidase
MKTALLLVDLQNDFADPSGSLYVSGGEEVATRLAAAIEHRDPPGNADLVVATKDWHGDHPGDHFDVWPVHCVASTWGAQFHPAIDAVEGIDQVFYKGELAAAYSGFEGSAANGESLDAYLRSRDVTDVTVVGLATDYCVKATALDAVRLGYNTTLDLEYCAGVMPGATEAAIAEIQANGVRIKRLNELP